MTTIDTLLRWLVRVSLMISLLILCALLFETFTRKPFQLPRIGIPLVFGGACIISGLALGSWSNVATEGQSRKFYILAALSIGLLVTLGIGVYGFVSMFD
jgi:hypothetical protein